MLPAQRVEPDVSKASPALDAEVLFSQSCPVPNAGSAQRVRSPWCFAPR